LDNTTCPPSFYALSDSSYWYWSQAWTLVDTKNGDGFDISGSVTKTKAMGGNGLYFAYPADSTSEIENFDDEDLFWNDYVSVSGHVSPTAANITFTVSNYSVGSSTPFANLQYTFSGAAWADGAKLNTSGTHPTTTGESKAVTAPPSATSSSSSSGASGISHTIIGAAAGGGLLLLLIIVCLAFCFCCGKASMMRKNRKRQRNLDQQYQQQRRAQEQNTPLVVYAPGQYQMQPPKYAQ